MPPYIAFSRGWHQPRLYNLFTMLVIKALGIFTIFFLIVYHGSAIDGRYDERVSRVFISLFWGIMSSLGFVLVETVL